MPNLRVHRTRYSRAGDASVGLKESSVIHLLKHLLAVVLVVLLGASCRTVAGSRVLVCDNFTSREKLADLSLLTVWGKNTSPTSALALVTKPDVSGLAFKALKMADEALPHSRWDQDLHAATAVDYVFPEVSRSSHTITVEFDALWDELESGRKGKWGEGNRLLVALVHDYPEGGPQFGDLARVGEGHPFGRPAYHFRVRNIRVGMGTMMSYGGGPAGPDGEFEKYSDGGTLYWLPGFISSPARGQAPGDEKTYDGKKSPYPIGPTQKGGRIASNREWRHVTWRVCPERLELYWRPSKAPPTSDQLVFFMDIPRLPEGEAGNVALCKRLAASHGLSELRQLPPLYNWFPTVEAVRFYFRGNQTCLANVQITVEPVISETTARGAEHAPERDK